MMRDFYPEHSHPPVAPAGFSVMLKVDVADAWYNRAVEAGCTAVMPVADMFWGRSFGVLWAINGPLKK
jgi:uncharacterized glyoxalase superfamily protein PhnB